MSSTGYFQYNMRTVVHSAWGGSVGSPSCGISNLTFAESAT